MQVRDHHHSTLSRDGTLIVAVASRRMGCHQGSEEQEREGFVHVVGRGRVEGTKVTAAGQR